MRVQGVIAMRQIVFSSQKQPSNWKPLQLTRPLLKPLIKLCPLCCQGTLFAKNKNFQYLDFINYYRSSISVAYGKQKIFQESCVFHGKFDIFRRFLCGTTYKSETLRLVFSYLGFSSRRYVYRLEFSNLTYEIFITHRQR